LAWNILSVRVLYMNHCFPIGIELRPGYYIQLYLMLYSASSCIDVPFTVVFFLHQ
jgi:hypothetical protein